MICIKQQLIKSILLKQRSLRAIVPLLVVILCILLLSPTPVHAQAMPPTQLTEIQANGHSSLPSAFAELNGQLLFVADDGTDIGLWRSDGTEAGTIRLAALPTRPAEIVVNGARAYLLVGDELWHTDGTTPGTMHLSVLPNQQLNGSEQAASAATTEMVGTEQATGLLPYENTLLIFTRNNLWRTSDLTAVEAVAFTHLQSFDNSESLSLRHLRFNGALYFLLNQYGDLWRTDGTSTGTLVVTDRIIVDRPFVLDDNLYFLSNERDGTLLWQSDGTSAGTQLLKTLSPNRADVYANLVTNGQGYYFIVIPDAQNKAQLWRIDGTVDGTYVIGDVGSHAPLFALDGQVYLIGRANNELWVVNDDSTDMTLQAQLPSGSLRSYLSRQVNDLLIFGHDSPTSSHAWISDGTTNGTREIAEPPTTGIQIGVHYFWSIHHDQHGAELWRSDPHFVNPQLVKDLNPGWSGLEFIDHAVIGDDLYLTWHETIQPNHHLIRTSGLVSDTDTMALGLQLDASPVTFSNSSNNLSQVPGGFYFIQDNAIWHYDDNTGGVQQLMTAPTDTFLIHIQVMADRIYFVAIDDSEKVSFINQYLGVVSAAPQGYDLLATVSPFDTLITTLNNHLFLQTADGLMVSDGSVAGTQLITTSTTSELLPMQDQMLILKPGFADSHDLWVSDGTIAGTAVITTIHSSGTSGLYPLSSRRNDALFAMRMSALNFELWRTDGTAEGTFVVKELPDGSDFMALTNTATGSYFAYRASDPSAGYRLAFSDGTTSGTYIVAEGLPRLAKVGLGESALSTYLNGVLYFLVEEDPLAFRDYQLWRSDGTAAGTVPMTDLYPNFELTGITQVLGHAGQLFLTANSANTGKQLWHFQLPSVEFPEQIYLPLIAAP